jgi:predicted nucleotidyltransferase
MLSQSTLDDIIGRIVEVAEPEKIILFGSAARGSMASNSDVDLLIIKDGADSLQLMANIYRELHGVGAAVDAIVVSSADVERYKDSHALVIKPALREGRVLYESPWALISR